MGAVKKRLAAEIGMPEATSVYRQILRNVTRALAADTRWRSVVAITPDSDLHQPWPWTAALPRVPQGAGGLGNKMARAIRHAPPGPVIIIGTDVPAIRPLHIQQAFEALGRHDAVFGPAADGGYWLVGVSPRGRRLNLFRNVRWSTEHALADTMRNIGNVYKTALLETLEDIDNAASLRRWQNRG